MISAAPSSLRKWSGPRSMVCMAVLLLATMPSAFAARATLMSSQQDISAGRARKLLDAEFSGDSKLFKTRTASSSDYETEGEFKQCISVPGGSTAKVNTQPLVWECNGRRDQEFTVESVTKDSGHKYYKIESNLHGNMCLTLVAPENGEAVVLRKCDEDDSAQLWRRFKDGNLSRIIPLDNNDLCLDTVDSKLNASVCDDEAETQIFMLADA